MIGLRIFVSFNSNFTQNIKQNKEGKYTKKIIRLMQWVIFLFPLRNNISILVVIFVFTLALTYFNSKS